MLGVAGCSAYEAKAGWNWPAISFLRGCLMATKNTLVGQDKLLDIINNVPGNKPAAETKGSVATSSALARRFTGPRTKLEKKRCRSNAFRHGILSEVILLKFERQDQFRGLLKGMRRAFKPKGMALTFSLRSKQQRQTIFGNRRYPGILLVWCNDVNFWDTGCQRKIPR